ncbi:hypothetical protein BDK51DRAFT_45379 [Blyttiomyces helicus]|uniref:Uncharacterized protein n=1 Tax=Blyttiomyces helicus TaxID=388810 RepID=A0A4P9WG21_9FUNG|nr:hypothetical protein BDK51DRAFT_45379 [Blyttiomyces helicus]|eukprot:RKO91739.1 hypothetical protein BDK51DRAFT_45379 [Blyttiomyces helicus]
MAKRNKQGPIQAVSGSNSVVRGPWEQSLPPLVQLHIGNYPLQPRQGLTPPPALLIEILKSLLYIACREFTAKLGIEVGGAGPTAANATDHAQYGSTFPLAQRAAVDYWYQWPNGVYAEHVSSRGGQPSSSRRQGWAIALVGAIRNCIPAPRVDQKWAIILSLIGGDENVLEGTRTRVGQVRLASIEHLAGTAEKVFLGLSTAMRADCLSLHFEDADEVQSNARKHGLVRIEAAKVALKLRSDSLDRLESHFNALTSLPQLGRDREGNYYYFLDFAYEPCAEGEMLGGLSHAKRRPAYIVGSRVHPGVRGNGRCCKPWLPGDSTDSAKQASEAVLE